MLPNRPSTHPASGFAKLSIRQQKATKGQGWR